MTRAALAFFVACILTVCLHDFVRAVDYVRWVGPPQELADMTAVPGVSGWFVGLTNQKGNGCCSDADGNKPEATWDNTNDPKFPYRVKIEGQWVNVPDWAVIKGKNRVGVAIVWYSTTRQDGKPPEFNIRCFLPGSMI